jgi:hypothetical protein
VICARCDQPIRDDEPRKTYPVDSPSGAAPDVTVHADPCKRVLQPTAPSGLGH